MRTRRLGTSDLEVSEFALGAMTFGMQGWGCDEATAGQMLDRFIDAGGNLIDTASGYGASEEILGRLVRHRRDRVVIATKFGLPVGPESDDRGAGRAHIVKAVERSLSSLGVDRIDLYQLHMDDRATPLEETLSALHDLVQSGKVRHIGASNMAAYRLMRGLSTSEREGWARFVSFQGQYNLAVRQLEREHLPLLADERLGFISWSPLAAGLLTGKVGRDQRPADSRLGSRTTGLETMFLHDHGFAVADAVVAAAAEIGASPAQVALAWQRTRPVDSVIIGARTLEQFADNIGALDVDLPEEIVTRLDEVSALPDEYPWTFIDVFQQVLGGRRGLSSR